MQSIRVGVISAWYNEEILAPLFLQHYDFADEIHIILDSATNDHTKEVLNNSRNVTIHNIEYPKDGLDWLLKQEKVNEVYSKLKTDWVIVADADEFVYKRGQNLKDFLAKQDCQIMWAKLYQVYRHETDGDLDLYIPPLKQRRHGIPLEPLGVQYLPNRAYYKPIVIKSGLNPRWDCGCHNYFNKTLIEGKEVLDGAHWHMADPHLAVKRRLQTKARQGKRNLELGLGIQNHFVTEGEILYDCWLHRKEPIVIYPDEEPLVSIIIPCYNHLGYTKQCIESIKLFTPQKHEVIVVDNGSTDGTSEWVKNLNLPNYKIIRNKTNVGFVKACNQGIKKAKGDYVLLLNNDTIVSQDWLRGLLDCIESNPKLAIVGPRTNFASGFQLDYQAKYQTIQEFLEFTDTYRRKFRGQYFYHWRIIGFCMLIRKSVLDKIGLLDERFSPGNFEDDDLCLRSLQAGYMNAICCDVFVHHYGSQTCKEFNFSKLLEDNKKKFLEKWKDLFEE